MDLEPDAKNKYINKMVEKGQILTFPTLKIYL